MGLNANVPANELPLETRLPATSLLAETSRAVDRAALLVTTLACMERRYRAWTWRLPGATAIVVPVPEAEAVVGDWRRLHTPSGAEGVPAHVTLLAPFIPAVRLDERSEGTGVFACACIFATGVSTGYGTLPVSAWKSTQVSAYTSVRASSGWASSCSGAM